MFIHEAVKIALENNKAITLSEHRGAKIKPTHLKETCIVMLSDGSRPSKCGWQPTAEQLVRDDWEIVD